MLLQKKSRSFLSSDFSITDWSTIEPVFENLKTRELNSESEFNQWLTDWDELGAALEEEYAWSYINMTINTKNEAASERYKLLISEISPKISPYSNELNKKLNNCEFKNSLTDEASRIWLKNIQTSIDLFREENIEINAEIQSLTQKYSALCGGLSVTINGEELTLPAAGALLQSTDRKQRKEVYEAVGKVRMAHKTELDELFNELVTKRHQTALNAGFENFRDFKFKSLGRWDFTKEDCFNFHDSVAKVVTPLVNEIYNERKSNLELSDLKPYDTSAPAKGKSVLKPFKDTDELAAKSIEAFGNIDPYFGNALADMQQMNHLDLGSKPGKSPGGYNYPLYETGAPFIFMNAVGTPRDLVTMMHEGGHAIHSFLTHNLKYSVFKSCPSEVAELASMAMELISMDQWHLFYENPEELKQAKKEHIEDAMMALPWIAMVDKFQHWIYENPNHTAEERAAEWNHINSSIGNSVVSWSGYETFKTNSWQKQLHIFELPFYYIEYGMAQLGAIAVWKNYKKNPEKIIEQYKAALSLGYTASVPKIYETAGIQFDFSETYISDLMTFMKEELSNI